MCALAPDAARCSVDIAFSACEPCTKPGEALIVIRQHLLKQHCRTMNEALVLVQLCMLNLACLHACRPVHSHWC